MVHLSHLYMTTRETIPLTRWTFVSKVMSLLFNTLFRFVITFLDLEFISFIMLIQLLTLLWGLPCLIFFNHKWMFGGFNRAVTYIPYFNVLHIIAPCRYFGFYKSAACGSPALSKFIRAISSTVFAHFESLSHLGSSWNISHFFVITLLWWSVISSLWYY